MTVARSSSIKPEGCSANICKDLFLLLHPLEIKPGHAHALCLCVRASVLVCACGWAMVFMRTKHFISWPEDRMQTGKKKEKIDSK